MAKQKMFEIRFRITQEQLGPVIGAVAGEVEGLSITEMSEEIIQAPTQRPRFTKGPKKGNLWRSNIEKTESGRQLIGLIKEFATELDPKGHKPFSLGALEQYHQAQIKRGLATNFGTKSISSLLTAVVRKGFVDRVEKGTYKITEKGLRS